MLWGLIVLINCIALTWVGIRYRRMTQALRWWFERQATALEHQSETIHNDLMQDLFAMRRTVELATVESGLLGVEHDELRYLEQIYHSLEHFSDILSPAYVHESLPLAIQAKLRHWKNEHPILSVELNISRQWNYEASYQNHLVICMLDEFLRVITLPTNSPTRLKIYLNGYLALKTLSIECTYSKFDRLKSLLRLDDLRYLQCSFNVLSDGKCFCWSKGNALFIQFQWKSLQHST